MQALNIPVPPELAERWRGWLTPEQQPFFLTAAEAGRLDLPTVPRSELHLSAEERDTFTVWRIPRDVDRVAWLSWQQWLALPAGKRRPLLHLQVRHRRGNIPLGRHYADLLPDLNPGHFLWAPPQLTPPVLTRVIETGQAASSHALVPEQVWQEAAGVLPAARELAGTFAAGPGNCFGTVMGASGVQGAENEWMQREPFEAFLTERARRGGRDHQPGTLLVWRSGDGLAQHAAVTLGGGWAIEKAAQTWWTPRAVLPVRELIGRNRTPGQKLTRYTLWH